MSVEELDTHPRALRTQPLHREVLGPPVTGSHHATAYDLGSAVEPEPVDPRSAPPLRDRVGAALAWVRDHRRGSLRALALLVIGGVLGAGIAGERQQAREQAAREAIVDVELAGVVGDGFSSQEPSTLGRGGPVDGTASLDLRNTGPLPVQVLGARADGNAGVRFTGVEGATLPPGEVSTVRLDAELDCTLLADVPELRLVLQVRAADGSVHDSAVAGGFTGAIGPWIFGWCEDTSAGRPVDVRYDEQVTTAPDGGVFRMALTLTSRDTEDLTVRGVESPFPTVDLLSGLEEPAVLPPARPVRVVVQFDLPSCELADSFAVPESLQLYVVPPGTELTSSSSPTVYAPMGTRFQRDLLAAVDRRCPRRSAVTTLG